MEEAMSYEGIQTLSHLALHFLLSPKHGREAIRRRVLDLNLKVKDSLHKGIFGVSKDPQHWPTPYYEKRIGPKPMECPQCGFQAVNSNQIELHHVFSTEGDAKQTVKKGSLEYYRTPNLQPLCANCHSLEHRTGEKLYLKCGSWHISLPPNREYENPNDIFSKSCPKTYRVQKNYFLKWHFNSPDQYKCEECNAIYWGRERKL
uniref:Putative HNH homing endonuclease n=1 Tax=Chlorogonium capillatum TaxID=71743 RepID=A0A0S2IDP5_9CHLO|nr:putative HNH homing endonuclease [Chlorogonium capillatum]